MEHRIAHACGHEQAHYLSGFASQMDRKAAWLKTTKCKSCFVAEKRTEQADAAAGDSAAIAHLALSPLIGSDRQIAWASTIRAKRLAAMISATSPGDPADYRACLHVTDAKWWIDHRELSDAGLIAEAGAVGSTSGALKQSMILTQSA
ncbi:hypothetical protein [Sphingomonas sp. BAUL-RG-20F-R05-02]|uniref:hypothetical protein n=1 Tax=Sphingomonas sp. BAUL-RG-20F-R05-02 TaxID=2914830 RepID=UPI001F56AEED|nr:hypothetical protein [Sphingomonas sp. BAUL-RG-20F-R05-02]